MGLLQTSINRGKRLLPRARQRRWPRRTAITVATILVLYGIAGFLGAPYALRRVLAGPVASTIHRAITVGKIRFNPYRLRLELDHLHVADRNPQRPFVDIGHLRIKVSWSSLFRFAPIIGEFYTDDLAVHIVRTGEQTFNFSDLITSSAPPVQSPRPSKPVRFAVSNIVLNDGAIAFDDELLGQKHTVEHIRLALPFIANLPADVHVFAQPFVQMIVDGSRFYLNAATKPFEQSQDTVLDLSLHKFDLTRYVAYVPAKLPIKIKSGIFSTVLHLHFINQNPRPRIRVDGGAALDAMDVRDQSGAPLLSVTHTVATIDEIEPLANLFYLKRIYVEGLNGHLAHNADGTTNLTELAESPVQAAPVQTTVGSAMATPTPSATIAATPQPSMTITPSPTPQHYGAQAQMAAPAATATPPAISTPTKSPLDFALGTFEIADSAVEVIDRASAAPATVKLEAIHAKLDNLRTVGESIAPYEFGANVAGGGALAIKGNLELVKHQITTDATIDQLDLPGLKAFAMPYLNGDLASGTLSASANVKTDFTPGKLNVHVEPANAAVDQFDLRGADNKEHPIAWSRFAIAVGQVDLAAHHAMVNEVRADGLKLGVKRDRQGRLNLAALLRPGPSGPAATSNPPETGENRPVSTAPSPTASAAPAPVNSQWQYQVAAVAIDKAEIHSIDEHAAKPVKLDVAPLGISLKNISSDLAKPIDVAVDGTVNGKGSLKIDGTVAPAPLDAKLRIVTKRVDLTAINPYIGDQLNTTIASAALTTNGEATATKRRDVLRAGYRGDVTLGGVRMLDKLTGDSFLRINSFNASHIAADYADGQAPKVKIGGLALANFYSRIILQSNGKLNLKDVATNPQEQATSLTRVNPESGVATPVATPAPTPTPASGQASTAAPKAVARKPVPKPLPAEIAIGGITLQAGHVNYTDNFIKPHYTADLTDIGGKIGAFGTSSSTPASVLLQGQVNSSAPLAISGSMNPLTPLASVDIAAKANAIELPGLSTYSTKYTGFPIVKGSLTMDVHYVLQNQKLTANNHIYLDQLTFGDKVESKDAINLPIRLAVAVLKDSRGAIDLNIPVSGSLNDPEFSIGGVIWHVVKNLILKAVTAPFSLITGAFDAVGGGGSGGAELNHIDFDPGYAKVTPESLKRLDVITKALTDRPALKLDIAGRVDPRVDRDGLRLAKVDRQVLAQKIKDTGEPHKRGEVGVKPEEYNDYLKKAYKAAKFEKPRDFIGLNKSLPPEEMKKLLVTNETVNDDDLHHLADERANAVRAALSQKIDPARLFIVPPKLNADDIKDQSKTTRADLSLE